MLAGGARDCPVRQQTIRNALAWSTTCSTTPSASCSRNSAFSPASSRSSGRDDLRTSLDVIASLVDKSLVQRQGERLGMLEDDPRVTRVEKLRRAPFADESATGTRRISRARRRCDAQRGSDEKDALDRLEADHDNLRAALDWLRTNAPARFVAMVGSLVGLWHLHSHFGEGRAYLVDALAMTPDPDETRARVLSAIGELAAWSGDVATARTSIEEAIPIWRESHRPSQIGASLLDLGWGWFNAGEDSRARDSMEEALRVAQATGERALINRARIGLLQMLVAVGELDQVEPMARAALAEAERQHDLRSEHFAHHFLADCPLIAGDAAAAAPRYRRGARTRARARRAD